MVEKTLEEIIDDFKYVDQKFKIPMDEGVLKKLKEEVEIFVRATPIDKETWSNPCSDFQRKYRPRLDVAAQKLQDQIKLLQGSKHQVISTWKECWERSAEPVIKYCKNYGTDTVFADTVINAMKQEIEIAIYYFAQDYLYRIENNGSDIYSANYVKTVLSSYKQKDGDYEKEDALEQQKLFRQLCPNNERLCLDLDVERGDNENQNNSQIESEINNYQYSMSVLDTERNVAVRCIYDRTTKGNFKKLLSIYLEIQQPKSQSIKQVAYQKNVFFSEIIGYLNKIYKDSGNANEFRSVIKTTPILLKDIASKLPYGANSTKREDRTGGVWTYEMMKNILEMVQLYSNFALMKTEPICKKDKVMGKALVHWKKGAASDKSVKIDRMVYDWVCEDLFHLKRLDTALSLTLDAMGEITDESDEARLKKEIRICALYANLIQFPTSNFSESKMTLLKEMGHKVANDIEPDIAELRTLYTEKMSYFVTLLSSCAYYLFTDEHGNIKEEGSIRTIVNSLAEDLAKKADRSGSEYIFKVIGKDEGYVDLLRITKNPNKSGKEKKYRETRDVYTKMKTSDMFRLMTSQLLFHSSSDVVEYRKIPVESLMNNIVLMKKTLASQCSDSEIINRYMMDYMGLYVDPMNYYSMVMNEGENIEKLWEDGISHSQI